MRRVQIPPMNIGDSESMLGGLSAAAKAGAWDAVGALALAGIYAELLKINGREEKREVEHEGGGLLRR